MSIKTGYSCPLCKRETKEINEVLADSQRLRCSKVEGHSWNDLDEFYNLGPTKDFKQEQERPAPQEGHTNVNVSIAVNTYNVLLSRYGDRLGATMAGALNVLAEGESMVITGTDLERLQMILGERPKNSSHLFGQVFALKNQVDEAKQIAETANTELKAYEGMSPGKVMLDMGEHFGYVKEHAAAEGMPMKVWLERKVQDALANQWF